jgi:hypothetical protein
MIDTVRRRIAVTPPAVDGPVILANDTSRVKSQELRFMIFMYTTNLVHCSDLDEPHASHPLFLPPLLDTSFRIRAVAFLLTDTYFAFHSRTHAYL